MRLSAAATAEPLKNPAPIMGIITTCAVSHGSRA